ncbi:MAG: hypothetical protein DRP01_06625 [Archaeoglobales archaeon]|nr:MAG: hypothetical protein DRP01_06625 [Archaeoglobales archaeon]
MEVCKLNRWLKEIYPKIVEDLKIDPRMDELSAKLMYELGREKLLDVSILNLKGKRVVVVGGAIKREDLRNLKDYDVIITSGKSILKVIDILTPDIHVTDMEEDDDLLVKLERRGCILVLHAHGDNIDRVRSVVPKLRRFVATTQVKPFDKVYNFLGFTDGDRAVLIAKRLGAKSIKLLGFDFKKAEGIKLKKLKWAEFILRSEGVI